MNSLRAHRLHALLAALERMDDSADRDRLIRETRARIVELEAGRATRIDWGDAGERKRLYEAAAEDAPIEFHS